MALPTTPPKGQDYTQTTLCILTMHWLMHWFPCSIFPSACPLRGVGAASSFQRTWTITIPMPHHPIRCCTKASAFPPLLARLFRPPQWFLLSWLLCASDVSSFLLFPSSLSWLVLFGLQRQALLLIIGPLPTTVFNDALIHNKSCWTWTCLQVRLWALQ